MLITSSVHDPKPVTYKCVDQCGNEFTLEDPLSSPPGWTWMEMRRGWRCSDCVKSLEHVNRMYREHSD